MQDALRLKLQHHAMDGDAQRHLAELLQAVPNSWQVMSTIEPAGFCVEKPCMWLTSMWLTSNPVTHCVSISLHLPKLASDG